MSYVAFQLPAWERNAHKHLAKSPKLHFWDARHLRNLDTILDKSFLEAAVLSHDPISRELEPDIRAHSITAFLS